MTKRLIVLAALLSAASALQAQTIEDGIMMPGKALCSEFLYGHDRWRDYWEGELKRDNGNIGAITTQSVTWMGSYGITDRVNVIAMVPYVWTGASQGVLHGMKGFQDLTLAAKVNLMETPLTSRGTLRAIVVASAGTPLSDYVADFLPLSIGPHSKRLSGRLTLDFRTREGWFLNGSAAYTWRGNVRLDRPAYFTEDQLFLTDEVAMPDVFDYRVSAGYRKGGFQAPVTFSQQRTLGGGDIRRQDMPFVSNRMNFAKVDAMVMRSLPGARDLQVRLAGTYTVSGRNVGQATTFTAGLLYTFRFQGQR